MEIINYIENYIFEIGSEMSPQYFDAIITFLEDITKQFSTGKFKPIYDNLSHDTLSLYDIMS